MHHTHTSVPIAVPPTVGYSGRVSVAYASGAIPPATADTHPRQPLRGSDAKSDMLLLDLQQHNRGRTPHYTGHKPSAPLNMAP